MPISEAKSQLPVKLHFSRALGPTSSAIAWFSAGLFSHVDAEFDGILYGARADKVGGREVGVWPRPPGYEKWKYTLTLELMVSQPKYSVWRQFLLDQKGKPYDKPAIWGFAFGRNWREDDSWFCSELQMAALEAAGISPRLLVASNKITPNALVGVAAALKFKKIGSIPANLFSL